MNGQTKSEKYISILEATKYCDYSQEYLSLRARQGKLMAKKNGRNWVTKKEWVQKYIEKNSQYNSTEKKLLIDQGPVFDFQNNNDKTAEKLNSVSRQNREVRPYQINGVAESVKSPVGIKVSQGKLTKSPEDIWTEENEDIQPPPPTEGLLIGDLRFSFNAALVLTLIFAGFFYGQNQIKSNYINLSSSISQFQVEDYTLKIPIKTVSKNLFSTFDNNIGLATANTKNIFTASKSLFRDYKEWVVENSISIIRNSSAFYYSIDSSLDKNISKMSEQIFGFFTAGQNINGITIYDEETGEPYCIKIKGGQIVAEENICKIQ